MCGCGREHARTVTRCVCGLSRVNFHLFPELVAHRCALCTLSHLHSAPFNRLRVRAPVASSCTSCSVHSSHNDDFHCVHGKLHRINFSSRRLVFPKFIFSLFFIFSHFNFCIACEPNSTPSFPILRVFHFSFIYFSCYFSVQSFCTFSSSSESLMRISRCGCELVRQRERERQHISFVSFVIRQDKRWLIVLCMKTT